MPYPAYTGAQFYFEIVIGTRWRHEFGFVDRHTGEPTVWEPGWQALVVIRDNAGNQVARLAEAGAPGAADGVITFTDGMVALELSSTFTGGLAATTTYTRADAKPFLFADLILTDPADGEPYLAASGKGVAYQSTAIGA